MLQPYWSPSNGDGPETRGAIIGFNEDHTRAHLYRAMIEGLTYALREGKELLEKKSGKSITRLSSIWRWISKRSDNANHC